MKHKAERNKIYVNVAIPGKPATTKEDAIREARRAAQYMPATVIFPFNHKTESTLVNSPETFRSWAFSGRCAAQKTSRPGSEGVKTVT